MNTHSQTPRGLTLVEMLVVLALLAVLSGMVVSLTDNMDQRERYNDTARRLTEIRTAILGPDAISADGVLLSGGYLQDTGDLPASGSDLIQCQPDVQAYMNLHFPGKDPYQFNATWHTWYGWRGPYVNRPPLRKDELTGAKIPVLYDGWGNDYSPGTSDSPPIPRSWSKLNDDYFVQSMGADGKVRGDGAFDKDYPDINQPLIRASEWLTPNLSGMQITVVNLTTIPLAVDDWRFRIVVPNFRPGVDPFDAAVSTNKYISTPNSDSTQIPAYDPLNPVANRKNFTFISNDINGLRVPMGHHTLIIVNGTSGQPIEIGSPFTAFVEIPFSRKLSTPSVVLYVVKK